MIRTAEDVGIVALLDDRFLGGAYQRLFPREWDTYEVVTADQVAAGWNVSGTNGYSKGQHRPPAEDNTLPAAWVL